MMIMCCNHTFCEGHAHEKWVADRRCPICNTHLYNRNSWEGLLYASIERAKTVSQVYFKKFNRLGLAACIIGCWALRCMWTLGFFRFDMAMLFVGTLLFFIGQLTPSRPVKLCMFGPRGSGKSTIGRLLESGLDVGPVFAPLEFGPSNGRKTYLSVRAGAAVIDLCGVLDGPYGETARDASQLNAIRLGDDYGSALLADDDNDDVPQTRWHAGASAFLPEDIRSPFSWSDLACTLVRGLGRLVGRARTHRHGPYGTSQKLIDGADGFMYVMAPYMRDIRRMRAGHQTHPDAATGTISELHFRRACQVASVRSRPLLVVCNKTDYENDDVCRQYVEMVCRCLNVKHATSGPRFFVHAASRGRGVAYLPEELRKRIYESAIANGPADAANGQSLRLEAGSVVRFISGGAIGPSSAGRLLEGVDWLSTQARKT